MVSDSTESNPDNGQLIYESTGASGLRVLTAVLLTFAFGSILLGLKLMGRVPSNTPTITETESNVWGVGLIVVFWALLIGVAVYLRRVAVRIRLSADRKRLFLTTASLLGSKDSVILRKDLVISNYTGGDKKGEQAFAPPRLWVHVQDSKSFVVSLSGKIPDRDLLLRVLRTHD